MSALESLPTVAELANKKPHLTPVVWFNSDACRDHDHTKGPCPECRVLYALQPKQMQAYRLTPLMREMGQRTPVHIGFGGAMGGGKSFLVRAVAVAVAFFWAGSRVLILREVKDDVRDNHFRPLQRELGMIPGIRWNETELTATFPNGSIIECGYLQYDKDYNRYQGNEYQCIIAEEATQLPPATLRRVVNTRLRGGPDEAVPFALYPSNPGGQGHTEFKRLFVQRRYRDAERGEDYAFVQSLLSDNVELCRQNPEYGSKFDYLAEPYLSWYRDGNFAAGAGSALHMLDWNKHLHPWFPIPAHWIHFGSYDWGFAHRFSFGWYVVNEDGTIYCVDTVTGTRMLDPQQIERIKSVVAWEKLKYTVAGLDAWHKHRARGVEGPTTADLFAEAGIILSEADTDRKMGLLELRRSLDWSTSGPIIDDKPTPGDPRLIFMDTPNNRRVLEQLEAMTADPNDPEDVLKVDADDFGEGGDDHYDQVRYAVMSRPQAAQSPWKDQPIDAWAPEVLAHEAREQRRSKSRRPKKQQFPPEFLG